MKRLFKFFTSEQDVRSIPSITWFCETFPREEFQAIELVLYLFLENCSELGVPAKRKYLSIFLKTDLEYAIKKYNIRLDDLTASLVYDEVAALKQSAAIISENTLVTYDNWRDVQECNSFEDFRVLVQEFMKEKFKTRLTEVITSQYSGIVSGGDVVEGSDNITTGLDNLRVIYNLENIHKLDFIATGVKPKKKAKKAEFISKTGIPAIDEDYGGLFTGALITFAGSPGTGKTRFLCAHFIYPTLVLAKKSVRLDSLELEDYEIENILLSIHIANLFKVKIPDRDMNRGILNDEQDKIVEAARIDLFESGNYGKFYLETESMSVEGMQKKLRTFLMNHPEVKLWCTDYVGRIQSIPVKDNTGRFTPRLLMPEIIDKALLCAKDLAKEARICAVMVGQFNDEGNKAAETGAIIRVGHIQGGQATQKHSDYDLSLTATLEQEAASLMMLSTTKKRASVGFRNVPIQTDKAISRFTQVFKETKS